MRWVLPIALLAAPLSASGQALSVDSTEFRRANDDIDPEDTQQTEGDPRRVDEVDGINLNECERSENWHYEVTTSGYSGNTLFVYTGSNCSDQASRDSTGEDCKVIERITLGTNSSELHEIDLGANEIANIDGEDCEALDDNLRVWFLVLSAEGDETPIASASSPTASDIRVLTVPPAAPSNLTTGAGESRAEVDWEGAVEGEHYYVACSPQPGAQVSPSATEPTADAEGQEVCSGAAPTTGFEAGATFDRRWRCDQPSDETLFADGLAAQSATVDGLENEAQYHFAAVAVDDVGNPSVLSEIACATPRPVEDFFEAYRRAGGRGGGGICGVTPGARAPDGAAAAIVLGLAALLSRRRR
ncbi:MAG: hypothetical protein HYY06_30905 [Deltaproteobacteria bacterium]|nr:hypothetical protein [Deltaproteobacteria bacterium]